LIETPEQAVIGNGQMLVTIGKHGELRYLFWPTIDYPQHILGSLPGIFYSNKNTSKFGWLTDSPWKQKQEYVENTNILLTSFKNSEAGLSLNAVDFVLPDADVLIRRFLFQNTSMNDVFLRFFYYNDLAISETDIDDAAYYEERHDAIIHYKRNFHLIYGGSAKSSGHQCGVHGEGSDAFNDVYDSKLSGDSLVLYEGTKAVNSCLSWDIGTLRSDEAKLLTVLIVMGSNEEEILRILEENRQVKTDLLLKRTGDSWKTWIDSFKRDFRDETLNRMMKRSLLVLKLLTDRNHGGIVAAPCMEPEYRFCWPRDATYVAYALDRCGFHEEPKRFYHWCRRAQEPEGGLYQRYYIEARIRGPCWSSQIDEIATVIWGIGKHLDLTGDRNFIESMWDMIEKAANYICANINPNTNLIQSVGLWEEKFGSHTYSNAAVYSALKTSVRISKLIGKNDRYGVWDASAEKIKNALLKLNWNPKMNRFIKTFNPREENLDISLLGLTFPFEVLPAQDERMKNTALAIEKAFNYKVGGIGRYPGDLYYEGNPWILSSLWLALYYEKLEDAKKMEQLINWAESHATEIDLLSEQIDKLTDAPVSAVPLAWSHSFFILATIALDELKANRIRTSA
jgi:glucoamylase